jgi:hypothetical protein
MPEITLPEVKLPDVKLPDGFRDMSKDDFVHAVREVKLPKNIKMPDVDLSDIDLPDAITDRMPGRRRPNPLVPIVALTVVGALIAAVWWLVTSSTTGPRIRRAVDDVKSRMNGDESGLVRYDDETHLDSLISQEHPLSTPTTSDPFAMAGSGMAEMPVATNS